MKTMSFGSTVNKEKNGALLAYIAEKAPGIHLRKLLKMVYLIDEKFMEKRHFPLTWFNYQAWEKGPVAPEVYAVKEGAFGDYVRCQKNKDGKNIVTPVQQHEYLIGKQMEAFSLYEKDSLWTKIKEEKDVVFTNGKSDVEIPLNRLNEGDEEKSAIYEDALDYMQFCNATTSC